MYGRTTEQVHSRKIFRNVSRTRGYLFNLYNATVDENKKVHTITGSFPSPKEVLAKNSALRSLIA